MSSRDGYGRTTMSEAPTTVDEYVAGFDGEAREIQRYGVHFAGWKTHVGIYRAARLRLPQGRAVRPGRAHRRRLGGAARSAGLVLLLETDGLAQLHERSLQLGVVAGA